MKTNLNSKLFLGCGLLIISLFPLLNNAWQITLPLTLCYIAYCFGIALVSDYIIEKISGESMLKKILSKNTFKGYLTFSLIMGLLLEGFATYLGGLWYYPFFTTPTYFLLVVALGGFAIYFLAIFLSYEAIKLILDKIVKGRKVVTKDFRFEKIMYYILLFIGIILAVPPILNINKNVSGFGGFVFDVSSPKTPYLDFWPLIMLFFALFFIFEFIQHKRHRNSLIKDTMHGYLNPLLAILLVSFILGLYMELQNLPLRLWIYSNWPLSQITIFGLPVVVLLTWPMHYIGFLSAYRAFGKSPSEEIWAGDKIR
ncbi:hypothetical protein A2982_02915 [candidate division WWE3 bacterium RIFCSPLOWO2_01_FULL_39_13]|uniref:Uncharacterized protein n=1 Tax=candidate division WWE3 bacterium RIFCSPLOWO2_01_FULL_39_13 TaxID=1802624 RepID=A0A1F4V4S3_UNCKA|nr:MAG: hypothetical protein A2982_02915 [candidate division WWE3 bacterium RIFCSPLOWO2_01_FULL_39_13]